MLCKIERTARLHHREKKACPFKSSWLLDQVEMNMAATQRLSALSDIDIELLPSEHCLLKTCTFQYTRKGSCEAVKVSYIIHPFFPNSLHTTFGYI